jgi:hypothetical protein
MRLALAAGLLLSLWSLTSAAEPAAKRPFKVGDVVEQYRHFDVRAFVDGPDGSKGGTRWKVLEITDDYVRLKLVSGKYLWVDGTSKPPGYTSNFTASDNYRAAFPGRKKNQQILEEYRVPLH